jgi:hypothetical protein
MHTMDKRKKLVAEFRSEAALAGIKDAAAIDHWAEVLLNLLGDWNYQQLRTATTLFIGESLRVQNQDDALRLAERFLFPNDERDEWLRAQRCQGVALKRLESLLSQNEHGWELLTVGGITRAIDRYCDRHPDKQRPPKRKSGRPKGSVSNSVK